MRCHTAYEWVNLVSRPRHAASDTDDLVDEFPINVLHVSLALFLREYQEMPPRCVVQVPRQDLCVGSKQALPRGINAIARTDYLEGEVPRSRKSLTSNPRFRSRHLQPPIAPSVTLLSSCSPQRVTHPVADLKADSELLIWRLQLPCDVTLLPLRDTSTAGNLRTTPSRLFVS